MIEILIAGERQWAKVRGVERNDGEFDCLPEGFSARNLLLEWASKAQSQDWPHLGQFRLLKNYLSGGRHYRDLPIEELRATWISNYRRNTRQPCPELARQEQELDAEFLIRHAPLPLGAVLKEMRLRIDAAVADVMFICQPELHGVPESGIASSGRHEH